MNQKIRIGSIQIDLNKLPGIISKKCLGVSVIRIDKSILIKIGEKALFVKSGAAWLLMGGFMAGIGGQVFFMGKKIRG